MEAYTTEELNQLLDKPTEEGLQVFRRDKLKGWMIANGHRKQDKPFGRAYIGESGTVMWFISKNKAFGFTKTGKWILRDSLDLGDNHWQPYPKEKWEAMLLEHAKSRGYKNGNYKCLFDTESTAHVQHDTFYIEPNGDIWAGVIERFGNKIFDAETGVWAEIIEAKEEAKDHFHDALNYCMGANDGVHFYFGIDFANVTDEELKGVFDFSAFTLNFETIDPNRYTLDEWIEIMKLGLERKK